MDTATQRIPSGYKQTDVGMIPKDWDVQPLRNLVIFTNGKAHEQNITEHGDFIVINSKFISTEGETKKYSDICIQPVSKNNITMVMSDVPNGKAIAKCFFVKRDNVYTLNQRICSMKAIADDPKYLFLQIDRNPYYLSFDDGVKQTNLKKDDVLNCLIKVPKNKIEQTAIANILSDTDKLIENLDKLIAKKKAIKQGAMRELLTGKRRLPGFSGKWEMKKLGELLNYEQPTKYLVNDTEYSGNYNIPVLTAGKTFVFGYTAEKTGIFRDLPVIIFDDFTTATKFVDFPFKAKSSAMKMLKPRSKNISLKFVFEKMQLIDFKLGDHKRYWISEYQEIEMDTPKLAEQTAIANVLSDIETGIDNLKKKLAKYSHIKIGMMQQLLIGRIRLV